MIPSIRHDTLDYHISVAYVYQAVSRIVYIMNFERPMINKSKSPDVCNYGASGSENATIYIVLDPVAPDLFHAFTVANDFFIQP